MTHRVFFAASESTTSGHGDARPAAEGHPASDGLRVPRVSRGLLRAVQEVRNGCQRKAKALGTRGLDSTRLVQVCGFRFESRAPSDVITTLNGSSYPR